MTSTKTRNMFIIICCLFVFLFTYTALNKLLDFKTFQTMLSRSPLIGAHASWLVWMLPLIELAIAILLLVPPTQFAGLRLSFVLMSFFTIYVAYMILFVPHLPCSCGGVISSLSWNQHLLLNMFLTLLALCGLLLKTRPEIFIRINRTSRTPV